MKFVMKGGREMLNSNCLLPVFTRPDSDYLLHRRDKDLSVPDLSCFGSPLDGLYHLMDQFVRNDELDLRFRQEINGIFSSMIRFGVTFCLPNPLTSVTVIP